MEIFTCEHTGRTFTNIVLYRKHVLSWPKRCKANGLNLDGTPINLGEGKPKAPVELMDGVPYKHILIKAGITKLDDIPNTLEQLVAIKGIGESSAKEILEWLEEIK